MGQIVNHTSAQNRIIAHFADAHTSIGGVRVAEIAFRECPEFELAPWETGERLGLEVSALPPHPREAKVADHGPGDGRGFTGNFDEFVCALHERRDANARIFLGYEDPRCVSAG